MVNEAVNKLTGIIIGAAIEVHTELGPGLLENIYEECLCIELKNRGIKFERQKEIPVLYKRKETKCNYRIDLIVENQVVVELKACHCLEPIHEAQTLTYMKLVGIETGLLVNFNEVKLKDGIRRLLTNKAGMNN